MAHENLQLPFAKDGQKLGCLLNPNKEHEENISQGFKKNLNIVYIGD